MAELVDEPGEGSALPTVFVASPRAAPRSKGSKVVAKANVQKKPSAKSRPALKHVRKNVLKVKGGHRSIGVIPHAIKKVYGFAKRFADKAQTFQPSSWRFPWKELMGFACLTVNPISLDVSKFQCLFLTCFFPSS